MRWYWIDRFLEFQSGKCARAVKNVSLAEEHVHDHFPGYPMMPASLMIEGSAQTAGLLVGEYFDFAEKVILAKITSARFRGEALPGDTLVYSAHIESINKDGAMVAATIECDEELLAELQIVFAHLNGEFEGKTLFDPGTFLHMLRMLKLFEVGLAADGSPLTEPAWMLQAEAP